MADPLTAIDQVLLLPQIDRILTSGGDGDWPARCQRFKDYATRVGPRITFLPGGGIDDQALVALAASKCVSEAHVGKAAREPQVATAPVSATRVHLLKTIASL